jgi:hypothetical protein
VKGLIGCTHVTKIKPNGVVAYWARPHLRWCTGNVALCSESTTLSERLQVLARFFSQRMKPPNTGSFSYSSSAASQ